jgi:hypothetical protein
MLISVVSCKLNRIVLSLSLLLGILFSSQVRAEDYMKFAEGSIVVEDVKDQLTFSERRDLVNHIVAVAKDRYLSSQGRGANLDEEATFEKINRYFPITIIRTTEPDMFAGMPFVAPEDLEQLAGSKILSYGKFSKAADVEFE